MILFDLDGTLIDSTEAILESFEAAYRRFGLAAPQAEAIVDRIGKPLSQMFDELGTRGVPAPRLVAAYKEHYRTVHRQKTVLLPGAREAIERAARFARLGVVTTKTGRYSIELLEHLGVMSYFEVLVGSEDVGRHKPDPEPVCKALALMGAEPSDGWLVGDTPMDIEAARAAGVRPFAVACGYTPRHVLEKLTSDVASNALFAVVEIEKRQSLL